MKKRIFALLLAGLITASMASCVTTKKPTNTGEDIPKLPGETTTTGGGSVVPKPSEWQEVNKTLYTVKATALYAEAKDSSQKLADLPAEAELTCTKQNVAWRYVECADGTKGYVLKENVTEVDILAKKFTPVDGGEKTMYVTGKKEDKLTIRLYPTTESFSTEMGKLSWNDAVTVVSTNSAWSRIKVTVENETKYYFVSSQYLASEAQIDYDDVSQWEDLFVTCDPALTKYVSGTTLHLRKAPNAEATDLEILKLDMEVTVKATAQIGESNWSYIEVMMPEKKEGDGPYLAKGYVNSKFLSDKKSTAPATLEDLLELYEGAFEALDAPKTMYVATTNLNVRSTPLFPAAGEESNIVAGLKNADEVKVVAYGAYEGNSFYVIEMTLNEKLGFYFVGASTLTTDPTGKPAVTLDDLTEKYPAFKICPEVSAVAKQKVNGYLKPDNSAENPDLQLETGDAVTIVARSTADQWCVIRAENGTLYFVNSLLLEEAAN